MRSEFFLTALADQRRGETIRDGIAALVEAYYDNYTDATSPGGATPHRP